MLTRDELMALLQANKGRSVLEFGQAVDAAAVLKVSASGPICGENPAMDADLTGCGKPIASQAEVYRCTDCGAPFHRECAIKHFANDTPESASLAIDEQIRRLDRAALSAVTPTEKETK